MLCADPPSALVRRSPDVEVSASRQRELPVFDPAEAERAVEFVRFVRLLVAWPMTTLGVLAFGAGLASGHVWFALFAGVIATLIPVSLWDDMRLARSLERLRRGDVSGAEQGLRRVASSTRRFGPQRQRACAVLAAIAWRRCDHASALQWVQVRLQLFGRGEGTTAGTADERWSTAASEVWLLALLGHAGEARAALDRLESATPDDDAQLVEMTAHLLVAFAHDDAEAVRPHLAGWQSVCESHDTLGLASVALTWALHACGQPDAAKVWAHRTRARVSLDHVRAHAPRLLRWYEGYGDTLAYARE
jgi:hypothetical protein